MIARALRAATLLAAALASLVAAPARADEIDKLASEVGDLEQQARMLDTVIASAPAAKETTAENRLIDAQVLMQMKDFTRAAILLLDVVEKRPESRVYGEALFHLGECLYQMRDYQSARAYFAKAAERPGDATYQRALMRLVELALRTGDYTGVEDWFGKLGQIPAAQMDPSVPYVRGKYFYFRGEVDQAIAAFAAIPPGHPYRLHAQYFIGACQVKKAALGEAAKYFTQVLQTDARTDAEKRIHELAQLALGRIHYEKGEFDKAIDRYQNIDRTSDLFDAALYEIAWVYIKAGDFRRAMNALDLLVLANPDSPFRPEVQILTGNLLIRLGQYGKATDVFSSTREEYDPIWRDLDGKMRANPDPAAYVDALLGRSLDRIEVSVTLPRLAVAWAREEADIMRLVGVVDRMREIDESLKETEQLLARLDRGVNGPARARIFPDLAVGRARALEIENKLVLVRDRLAQKEREIVAASGAAKAELDSLARERRALEDEIRKLPKSSQGYETRARAVHTEFDALDRRASELSVLVDSLRAQLVATEKYVADTHAAKTEADAQSFKLQIGEMGAIIAELEKENDDIRQTIVDAKSSVGIGDALTQHEDEIKRRYNDALLREHEMTSQLASRLSAGEQARLRKADGVVRRAVAVQALIDDFGRRLDAKVDERLGEVRKTLDDEKRLQGEYAAEYRQYAGESKDLGTKVAEGGFQNVLRRFYDIVVQSDVGIIDVAWALKQEKTDAVGKLVRDQKDEIRGLDQGFQEVLGEVQ